MCDPITIIAAASLAMTGYSTLKSVSAAKDQSKAQQKAIKLQQSADDLRQARERRQVIREQRIKQASIVQAGANQGATGSSSIYGGVGSLTSQGSANLGFLDAQGDLNTATTQANKEANQFGADANMWGSMANFGATIFQASGSFGTLFGDLSKPVSPSSVGQTIGKGVRG